MKSFLRRGVFPAGLTALLVLAWFLQLGCGDIYRPVANPISPPGGDPQAQHVAVVVNNNDGGQGSTTQVDVSGDTNIGNFQVGLGPVHAITVVGTARAYVVNKNSDSVSYYAPTSLGSTVATITLPAGSVPVFIGGTEPTALYVALSGKNAVGVLNIGSEVLTGTIPVGNHPVALAETPDGKRLFVLNEGNGTVSAISTTDQTLIATIPVGTSPVWAAMNSDGTTLYVANQGSGTVSVIDTNSANVIQTLSVGAAPRFLVFDSRLRRLYVANTGSNTISVFNADKNPVVALGTVTVGAGPASIAPLADGTRAYVANAGCADPVTLANCTGNSVSVVDATGLFTRKTVTVGATPVSLDSSADSLGVIVANRDSNNISASRASDDTVVATIAAGSPKPVFVVVSH